MLSSASKVVKTNLSAEQVLTYVAGLERLNPTKIGHGVAKGPTGWAGQQSIVVLGDRGPQPLRRLPRREPLVSGGTPVIRRARTADVRAIRALVAPLAERRVLVSKEAVTYFESLQEFRVADLDGRVVGCGALHVMWEDLAEIRTLAVAPDQLGTGLGGRLLETLVEDAREIGVERLFCLTFETDFFVRHGFEVIEGQAVPMDVYAELLRSYDEGVAEFLDLERVKPNTSATPGCSAPSDRREATSRGQARVEGPHLVAPASSRGQILWHERWPRARPRRVASRRGRGHEGWPLDGGEATKGGLSTWGQARPEAA